MSILSKGVLILCIMASFVFAKEGPAKIQSLIKQYFNSALEQINEAETPAQQRQILDRSLDKMISVLGTLQTWPDVPQSELLTVQQLRQRFVEKQDELQGRNGYERVSDKDLVAFANYVQQDMENAGLFPLLGLTNVIVMVVIFLMN
jgi:hypothetical protein